MAEYIEKSAAVAFADYAADEHPYEKQAGKPETCFEYNQGWNDACDYIRDKLEEAPAADVAPVRHGRWILVDKSYGEYECSVCHARDSDCSDCYGTHIVLEQKYCHNCGAKMDLEDEA